MESPKGCCAAGATEYSHFLPVGNFHLKEKKAKAQKKNLGFLREEISRHTKVKRSRLNIFSVSWKSKSKGISGQRHQAWMNTQ